MRIHRVYCKSLSGPNKQFDLDEPQSRHLIKALRIKENDVVEVFDGMGDVAKCIVIKLTNKLCSVERTEDIRSDTKSKAQLKAIIPIIKKNNFNFMLQKIRPTARASNSERRPATARRPRGCRPRPLP